MPEEEIKKRGGAIRYRTVVPKKGKYIRIAVTRKKGPRGGKTVAGPVHSIKFHKSCVPMLEPIEHWCDKEVKVKK